MVSKKPKGGWTALHWAAATGRNFAEAFAKSRFVYRGLGKPKTRRRGSGDWPQGEKENDYSVWKLMKLYKQETGYTTPEKDVGHVDVISVLDHGARIDLKGWSKQSALCLAVTFRHEESVKLLLERGADMGRCLEGPVMESMLRVLLDGHSRAKKRNKIPESELDATFLAYVTRRNAQVVILLLTHGAMVTAKDQTGDCALQIAATWGSLAILNILLDEGLDINIPDRTGCTALHHGPRIEVLELLLSRGANIDARNLAGETTLHTIADLRVDNAVVESIQLLLNNGADPNASDKYGKSPLHYAIGRSSTRIVELLLKHGATLDAKDNQGLTPLHWAVIKRLPNLVEILIAAGADPTARGRHRETVLHKIIYSYSSSAFSDNHESASPRDQSSGLQPNIQGHVTWEVMVKLLLDHGLDPFAVGDTGCPAYQVARAVRWRSMLDILTKLCPPRVSAPTRIGPSTGCTNIS